MRILTVSSLFPNGAQPNHGIFVENRLKHIRACGDAEFLVIAPVPWFPSSNARFGRYATFARVARREQRDGVPIHHPRVPVVPKLGMTLAPLAMYLVLRSYLSGLIRQGYEFDLIDAHYFYPDGVAAAMLARAIGKPLVISARGSDMNVIASYRLPGRMIRWAGGVTAASIAVSHALKRRMIEVGLRPEKIHVLSNGVDLEMFRPIEPRQEERGSISGTQRLLAVGNLVPIKAQDRIIRALKYLPNAQLSIAGQGDREAMLRQLVKELHLEDRVRFLGAIPHGMLAQRYSAADLLVHASRNEGWPNVLLESIACGTPVVATDVGGTAEIVTSESAGLLVPGTATPEQLAESIVRALQSRGSRQAVRAHAAAFGWQEVAKAQFDLYRSVTRAGGAG